MRRTALALGVLLVSLSWAADALGATVTMTSAYGTRDHPGGGPPGIYSRVEFVAVHGEENSITVTISPDLDPAGYPTRVDINDASATIEPAGGCVPLDAHTVRCTPPDEGHLEAVSARAGDQDDSLSFGGASTARVAQRADGGSGNDVVTAAGVDAELRGGADDDTLVAGAGADTLIGGQGADRLQAGAGDDTLEGDRPSDEPVGDDLDGGDGVDRVSYVGRDAPVRVDLSTGIGGVREERDRIVAVENVDGGRAGDTLIGNEQPNGLHGNSLDPTAGDVIIGGGGDDFLSGSAGDDRISGGSGGDRIDGGGGDILRGDAGDDTIHSGGDEEGANRSRVHCGTGNDSAGSWGDDIVDVSCEHVGSERAALSVPRLVRRGTTLAVRIESRAPAGCPLRVSIVGGYRPFVSTASPRVYRRRPHGLLASRVVEWPPGARGQLMLDLNQAGKQLLNRKPRRLLRIIVRPLAECFQDPDLLPLSQWRETFRFRGQ